jgi:hypothetical protein
MFKDLQKLVQQSQQQRDSNNEIFERLIDKPFWIWDIKEHKQEDTNTKGDCCFNHIIGLPIKGKLEKPLFDYEKLLYDSLLDNDYYNPLHHAFKHKHLWIKKSTGLGVTEFFLRLMAWLCLRNDDYQNSQMCIVTGPNIDIAIKLIKRMKGLFEPKLGVTFDSKETVLELNGCSIEAYPSNHLDAYRALENPKFILLEEADFFRKGEQEDVRHVSERLISVSFGSVARELAFIAIISDCALSIIPVPPSSHFTAYFNPESIALSQHISLFSIAIASFI